MADDRRPKDNRSQTLSPSEYSHAITKIAATQICQTVGFRGSQASALDALTRIATLYLQSLAKCASSSAAILSGRTECNLFDIVRALEELGLPAGFSGAGDAIRPLLSSSTLKELRRFVYTIDEVPFASRIPRYDRNSRSVVFPAMSGNSSLKMGSEVPRWLPGFPCFEEGAKRVSKREVCWEEVEKTCDGRPLVMSNEAKESKGGGSFMLLGRREKVKFRLGTSNAKVGGDDLELRNGVCTGGKRICLVKSLKTTFFDGDEEQPMDMENGKIK